MNLSILCDVTEQVTALEQVLGDDLPFTIARFLTMQAQSGQEAAREGERTLFKLRNDWTVRNTKITPAKKTTLFSEVFTDTSNRKTGAPDYLPRQQEGGERTPAAGHSYLAIPTRYLYRVIGGKTKIIPDAFRPKQLLPPGADLANEYSGTFGGGVGGRPKRGVGKATRKKLGTNEFVAFVQVANGTLCIFVRHGGIGFHGREDAEPWYVLVHGAHVPARFPMEELVAAAVNENIDVNFNRAAAEVLVNKLMSAGFRVQF